MNNDKPLVTPAKPIVRSRTGSSDFSTRRNVHFAESSSMKDDESSDGLVIVPTKKKGSKRNPTAETFSDKSSVVSGDSASTGVYEVIEYDPTAQVRASVLNGNALDSAFEGDGSGEEYNLGTDLDIQENTPAAEALRASAAVRVSRVGKAARAVHMQAVRKLVKRATGTTKHGVVKGKPPRLPPHTSPGMQPPQQQAFEDISEGDEESEMEDHDQINETAAHDALRNRNLIHHPTTQSIARDHMPDDVVAGTAEAGKKVLESVDTHDIVKVLKWRKKRKGTDDKAPKSYAKGKVIDGEHELYTLSIAVMIGVRTSISKTNVVLNAGPSKRWVLLQDYRTTEKYEFRPKGGTGMPAHQLAHTFKFKDYAPVVFAYLRRMAGINEYDFLISVCGNANFIEFISNAKSGQFFFYSSDGRYMIKTMTNAESKFLRRILPDYFRHCCENPNTMVTKFFGMYRVKLYHLRRNVKFVIMNSVYHTDKYLQTFYDLKGSVVGRDAKPGQAVLKDNDLRRVLPHDALALNPATRAKMRKQLEKDCTFLEKMGIMDYSMLVGVHHVPPATADTDRSIATTGYHTLSSRKLGRSSNSSGSTPDNVGSQREANVSTPQQDGLDQPLSSSVRESNRSDETPMSSSRRKSDDLAHLLFEEGLDDDDSSYLRGSDKRPKEIKRLREDVEQKKLVTIEKLYWPFHHMFDIHGYRRMQRAKCATCDKVPCKCIPDESLAGYEVTKFCRPLSDRKDGGFEMDTTGLPLPMVYKGPSGDQQYEGKIFYMGIIDILQEYNGRKMVEAQYRLFQAQGHSIASCVDPRTYAQRFLAFFDEYTTRGNHASEGVEMTLSLHESNSGILLADDGLKTPDAKIYLETLPRSASEEGYRTPHRTPELSDEKSAPLTPPRNTVAASEAVQKTPTLHRTPSELSDEKSFPLTPPRKTVDASEAVHRTPDAFGAKSEFTVIEPARKCAKHKTTPRSAPKRSEDALCIMSPVKKHIESRTDPNMPHHDRVGVLRNE